MHSVERIPLFKRIRRDRALSDYYKVRAAYSWLIRNRAAQARSINLGEKRHLNVGCGPRTRTNFVNLDRMWGPGIDLCWDIAHPLPFAAGTFEGAYSEHCFEHVTYETGLVAARGIRQVLKPGATIRIVVPDAEMYLRLYVRHHSGEAVSFPFPRDDGWTAMKAVNQTFRRDGHQFAYDAETLCTLLRDAGYLDARRESFGNGRLPALLIDSPERRIESLYVEAIAP